jgi:hypothetical protein
VKEKEIVLGQRMVKRKRKKIVLDQVTVLVKMKMKGIVLDQVKDLVLD